MPTAPRAVDPALPVHPAVDLGDGRVLTRTAHGFGLLVDAADVDVAPSLITGGLWEPALTRRIVEQLTPGGTFVDVGAHLGYFTVLAAKRVGPRGHVTAVEPHAPSLQLLAQNLFINALCAQVRVAACAADRGHGTRTLYAKDDHAAGATLHGEVAPGPWVRTPITTAPLDAILEGVPCEGAVIKIDAEGSEPAIWEGMRSVLARHGDTIRIALEFCPLMILGARDDPAAFLARIRQARFVPRLLEPEGVIRAVADAELLSSRIVTILLARDPRVWSDSGAR